MHHGAIVAKRVESAPRSQQKTDTFAYDRMECAVPPFPMEAVARAYVEDPDVYLCCNAIAAKACGAGWEISGSAPAEALAFFEDGSPDRPLIETLRLVFLDLNLLGSAYLEIARDAQDRPAAMWWVPACEVRARRNGDGYCQRTETDRYTMFNPYTPDRSRRQELRRTGAWHASREGGWANEIIAFRLPNPAGKWYGLPPALLAAQDVLADACVKASNISFFQNGMMPDYVLSVKGGSLSDGTLEELRAFLNETHRGADRHHGMIVLEALPAGDQTVGLELIPMQPAMKDMPFLAYRKFAIENKVRAFRVPLSKAGINQAGRLGEASGREETETFKSEVVEPQQTMVEHAFRRVLRSDFGATDAEFRFKDLDLRDTTRLAETASLLTGGSAVLTVDEARATLGYGPKGGS